MYIWPYDVKRETFFEMALTDGGTRGNMLKIQKKFARLNIRKNSFSHRVVIIWNNLPDSGVCAVMVNDFKIGVDLALSKNLTSTLMELGLNGSRTKKWHLFVTFICISDTPSQTERGTTTTRTGWGSNDKSGSSGRAWPFTATARWPSTTASNDAGWPRAWTR